MRERNGNDRGHHDISDREPPWRKERKEDNHDGACESDVVAMIIIEGYTSRISLHCLSIT